MTKNEIIKSVSAETGVSRKEVRTVFNAILSQIESGLCNKERVIISGFGVFEVTMRTVSDFSGGEVSNRKRVMTPVFRAGKGLKDSVGGENGKD